MKKVLIVVVAFLLIGFSLLVSANCVMAQDPQVADNKADVKASAEPAKAPAAEPAKAEPVPAAVKITPAPTPAAPAAAEPAKVEAVASAKEKAAEAEAAPEVKATPLTPEKKTAIQQAADKLIREEITAVGSFEVDHPETGDLINLSLEKVQGDVTESGEGEYLLKANFKDKAGAAYVVAIYIDEISAGEYELADAIVESIDGKAISGV